MIYPLIIGGVFFAAVFVVCMLVIGEGKKAFLDPEEDQEPQACPRCEGAGELDDCLPCPLCHGKGLMDIH